MLTQVDVMSEDAFELPIEGATPKSSLLVKKITGLNPPAKTLFIGEYSQDGGIYQGRRVGNRNVVFTIDLNPNPALGETVSSLRKALYKAFNDPQPDGEHLKVLLHDDDEGEVYFVGYCETFEAEVFDIETMCQISMICPDPYLRANQDTIISHSTGLVNFSFTYEGSAETGFIVRINVAGATNQITLDINGRTMKLEDNLVGYSPGDIIVINTIRGRRSISLTSVDDLSTIPPNYNPNTNYVVGSRVFYDDGVWLCVKSIPSTETLFNRQPSKVSDYWEFVSTPIVSHLLPSSQWLELHSEANTMRVYQGSNVNSAVANINYLKYTSAYWGI